MLLHSIIRNGPEYGEISHDRIVYGAATPASWTGEFLSIVKIGMPMTVVVSLILYVLSSTLGWIAAGFAPD